MTTDGSTTRSLRALADVAVLALVVAGLLVAGRAAVSAVDGASGMARDLGGVFVVALALGTGAWWLLRRWVPRLIAARGAVKGREPDHEPNHETGAWLLGLRWLAVIAVAAVVFQATAGDARVTSVAAWILWAAVAALAAFDVALTWRGPARAATPRAVAAQIAVDVAALAACLHSAGGVLNPFAGFFVFHAVIAALLLRGRAAVVAVALVAAVALALAVVEASGLVPALCLRTDGRCLAADPIATVAFGAAVAALSVGCAVVVYALTRRLHAERDALAEAGRQRAREAAELVAAERSLAAEQGRLEAVLDCIADAVLFAAPDGRIVLANRAASALWPDHPDGVAADLRVCHERDRWGVMLAKLANPGTLEVHPILPIQGRLYDATYGRVTQADGTLLGAVMVARDVTERVEEQRTREQRERMSTIGKMAAALAHEINNPLGAIQLYTQHVLRKMVGQPDLAEHLTTVLRNANVAGKIVRDLLEYARQRPPEKRAVTPAELLDFAVKTVRPRADQVGVTVTVDPGPPGLTVDADVDQLVQVLVNLALNGIEAMADDGVEGPRRLALSAATGGDGEVVLTVADTGPGVPEAVAEGIFSPFYTTKAEGTGLGLAVVRDIAAAHAGRVALLPSEVGATFAVYLPAHRDAPAQEQS